MKRRILIISAILILVILAGSIYINQIIISPKMRDLIVKSLEETTQKRVILGSLKLSIFKGIVIKDLIIYDGSTAIINAREAACIFLIQPLFNKQIIIPVIKFNSPEIFIERRPDGFLNIIDLFSRQDIPKGRYKVIVRKISVENADVILRDNALETPFIKEIKGADLDLFLSLPASVKFNAGFELPGKPPAKISVSGHYEIAGKELGSDIEIKDFEPKEVSAYYERFGFILPEGRLDAKIALSFKDAMLGIMIDGETKGLVYSKDNLTAKLDSSLEAGIEYNFNEKAIFYSGKVDVRNMELAGIETIRKIEDIKGDFVFDNSGLSCDNLSAKTLSLAVDGKLYLADFANPLLDIEVNSDVNLTVLENILKDPFKIKLPANLEGSGRLFVSLQYNPLQLEACRVAGYMDTAGSRIVMDKAGHALEDVTGRFQYTPKQLSWSGLKFKYADKRYETYGIITNFDTPGIQLSLASQDVALDAIFAASGSLLTFSKFEGQYLNSAFSLTGELDTVDKARLAAKASGMIDFNLADLKVIFKNSKEKLDKAKLSGRIRAQFDLAGNINDIKSCSINAAVSSGSFSVYDLKPSSVSLNYRQKDGEADIPFMHAVLYGGTLDANAKIGLLAKDLPYSVNADISNVKIKQLKADTAFKDKEISGSVKTKIRLSGCSNDLSRLTGGGRIDITNGKLWQLNLFRGLGVLLFSSDFSNIIFSEGSCGFVIKEKGVMTNNLELKSGLIDMYGSVKLGFDNSIAANLKAEVTMEALESMSAKTVTVAIGRYTFIEITGTLKEPKYRIRPDVPSMVEDLAEAVFQR